MAKDKQAFTIDDAKSTADNRAAYAELLKAIDGPLGSALSAYLASLSSAQPHDAAEIWNALYEAAASTDLASPHGEEANDTKKTA